MTIPGLQEVIDHLELQPHPEGGFFKPIYRSDGVIARQALPPRFTGNRAFSTGIYFLLTHTGFSAFHQLKADEGWHFYLGDSIAIYMIRENGELDTHIMGKNLLQGEVCQAYVPAGSWFAAKIIDPRPASYALVGCTVAPGFEFEDFTLAQKKQLIELFPQHQTLIEELTRD